MQFNTYFMIWDHTEYVLVLVSLAQGVCVRPTWNMLYHRPLNIINMRYIFPSKFICDDCLTVEHWRGVDRSHCVLGPVPAQPHAARSVAGLPLLHSTQDVRRSAYRRQSRPAHPRYLKGNLSLMFTYTVSSVCQRHRHQIIFHLCDLMYISLVIRTRRILSWSPITPGINRAL